MNSLQSAHIVVLFDVVIVISNASNRHRTITNAMTLADHHATYDELLLAQPETTLRNLSGYLEYQTYTTYGDSHEYMRFLQDCASNGSEHASNLVDSMVWIKRVNAYIQKLIDLLYTHRMHRMANVCREVQIMQSFTQMRPSYHWQLCNITGMTSNELLYINTEAGEIIAVHADYALFLEAFWLITHIDDIQKQRITCHAASCPEPTISACHEDFQKSKYTTPESEIAVYAAAMRFVIKTLQLTLEEKERETKSER